MILVYLGRWSYGRFKDDNNIFYKRKKWPNYRDMAGWYLMPHNNHLALHFWCVMATATSHALIRIGQAMFGIRPHHAIPAMVSTPVVQVPANAHHAVWDGLPTLIVIVVHSYQMFSAQPASGSGMWQNIVICWLPQFALRDTWNTTYPLWSET